MLRDSEMATRELLFEIEQALREARLWDSQAPSAQALASIEPFAIDTLAAHQWLQWIFLPRMHALIDAKAPLPTQFAITPYFEEALKEYNVERLLMLLQRIDSLGKRA